jgi:CubicO group peptidase (beta-lactamase class C family)
MMNAVYTRPIRLPFYAFLLFVGLFTVVEEAMAQDRSGLQPGLDKYINNVLKTFEVPGMSVAIVKDGKTVLATGYGVKKLGNPDPVDGQTLFSIASNSKAFTATALAILVEDGKLKWDDQVIEYLPWFKMADSYVTSHLTIRDLLVHQSGLTPYAGDLMLFPPSSFTRREILSKLPKIPLKYEFRTTYGYDNILYLAAGEIISSVSHMEWEDFIKKRIFDKVGMPGSLSRYSQFKNKKNVAAAHDRIDGKVQVLEDYMDMNIGDASDPAGGILSNAKDMSNWMITQLDSGRTPSKQVLYKPASTKELWKLVRPIPIGKIADQLKPAQMDFFGYALGIRTYNYQKYKVVGHGGKLDGFVSQIAMVPELNLGIAIFTNQESTAAYWSVIYHVLDYYMKNKPFDWVKGYKEEQDKGLAKLKTAQEKNTVKQDSGASFKVPLNKLAGKYKDEVYGEVEFTKTAEGLKMDFKELPFFTADLKYFQYNTFYATFRKKNLKTNAYVTFALNPDGTVDQVKMEVLDPDSDITFNDVLLKPVLNPKNN